MRTIQTILFRFAELHPRYNGRPQFGCELLTCLMMMTTVSDVAHDKEHLKYDASKSDDDDISSGRQGAMAGTTHCRCDTGCYIATTQK